MSNAEIEFDELKKNNKELIQEHIKTNNDYHEIYFRSIRKLQKLEKSLENPIIQRYEELLDIMEEEDNE